MESYNAFVTSHNEEVISGRESYYAALQDYNAATSSYNAEIQSDNETWSSQLKALPSWTPQTGGNPRGPLPQNTQADAAWDKFTATAPKWKGGDGGGPVISTPDGSASVTGGPASATTPAPQVYVGDDGAMHWIQTGSEATPGFVTSILSKNGLLDDLVSDGDMPQSLGDVPAPNETVSPPAGSGDSPVVHEQSDLGPNAPSAAPVVNPPPTVAAYGNGINIHFTQEGTEDPGQKLDEILKQNSLTGSYSIGSVQVSQY